MDTTKRDNLCIIGVPEEEERERGQKGPHLWHMDVQMNRNAKISVSFPEFHIVGIIQCSICLFASAFIHSV